MRCKGIEAPRTQDNNRGRRPIRRQKGAIQQLCPGKVNSVKAYQAGFRPKKVARFNGRMHDCEFNLVGLGGATETVEASPGNH
mmetsp:Transcript_11523/g.16900  ORF Transcript_11523/g.16900 Transcript_11523/m.16900 type:complete len:83 (-) Transcript_11523:339-587(-)